MKLRARLICVISVAMLVGVFISTRAYAELRLVAYDDASNYTDWGTAGLNGGAGLDEWVFVSTNAAGGFLADGAANLTAIGTAGKAWGAYANNSNSDDKMAAFRGFGYLSGSTWSNCLENPGDRIKVSFEHEVINGIEGSCGLTLRHGNQTWGPAAYNDQSRFEFGIFCDDEGTPGNTYTVYDGTGGLDTGVSKRKSGLDLELTLETPDTYSLKVYDATNSVMITNITGRSLDNSGTIDSIALYARNIDGGTENDAFFNKMEIWKIFWPTVLVVK